jgi:hypothetical protein
MQSDDALLDNVQCETFAYFLHEVNERNGLVADCPRPGWPCSIAATGLGLAFSLLFPGGSDKAHGWRSEWNYGINQGPIVLMVENHRTGLP